MSQLGLILQESLERDQQEERTILGLLTEQMESTNNRDPPRRRRTFKKRLRFTRIGCCGATWGFTTTQQEEEEEEEEEDERREQQQRLHDTNPGQRSDPDCLSPSPSGPGMNLSAALAAEGPRRGSRGGCRTVADEAVGGLYGLLLLIADMIATTVRG